VIWWNTPSRSHPDAAVVGPLTTPRRVAREDLVGHDLSAQDLHRAEIGLEGAPQQLGARVHVVEVLVVLVDIVPVQEGQAVGFHPERSSGCILMLSAAECCVASITIRSVPDASRDELAARAARSGRSLQEYLRAELIELARRPEPAALLERIQERKRHTASELSTAEILGHLDADRR